MADLPAPAFLVIAWQPRRGLLADGGVDLAFLGPYTEAEAQAVCARLQRGRVWHRLHPLTTAFPEWLPSG